MPRVGKAVRAAATTKRSRTSNAAKATSRRATVPAKTAKPAAKARTQPAKAAKTPVPKKAPAKTAKQGAPKRAATKAAAPRVKPVKIVPAKATKAPKAAGPKAVSPKAVSPKAAGPKAVSPKAVSPKVVSPKAVAEQAPPAPKPPKPKPPRKPTAAMLKFFEKQREVLLEERATYTHQAEALRLEAEQLAEEMEPGDIQFDEESGEGATVNVERERDLAMSAQASAAVEEIDRALAKIENGTYGLCEQCGQTILRARLEALPYAALCVACKSGGLSRR
jgi:RNA polymerase-binding transcription factor DksA